MKTAAAIILTASALFAQEQADVLLSRLPAAPAAGRAAAEPDRGRTISFNFERVDIRAFAQIVGEFTGRRFSVADDVDGAVTVVSPDVTKDEAYALFGAVLESSGYALVKEGDLDRVVRLPERKNTGIGTVVEDASALPDHGLVTRILRLEHVSASDMRAMLESHLQRKDSVSVLEETNHLVITDTAEAVRRVEELVAALDSPGMARVTEVIPLEHADASALARQISAAFAESQSRAQQLLTRIPAAGNAAPPPAMRAPTIVPAEHANRLIVSGSQRQLQSVKDLVAKMDIPAPSGRSALNAIALNYIKAADLAKNITTLLEKFAAGATDPNLSRRIAVEAVESSNALLVNAAPGDFREVQALVEKLDVMPRQVHISVLIAEVQEGDEDTLGVRLNAAGSRNGYGIGAGSHPNAEAPGSALSTLLANQIYPEGISFGVLNASGDANAIVNIDAIRENSAVKILANPTLGAQNNTEAEVSIVDNIPMTESTVSGSGSNIEQVQSITRYDVGVKLTLVPHIVPGGLVQIELQPSIEAVTKESVDASGYAPTISKRSVKTTMTVPDGETIVIAGLTRADTKTVKRRVPLLGSIPLLGWLFRWESEVESRTSILIFVTPTVMTDSASAQEVRKSAEAAAGITHEEAVSELSAEGED